MLLQAHDNDTTAARWFTERKDRLDIPIDNLNDAEQDQFMLGRSFFTVPWVLAPSATTARDGLGPLFNANTCASCHRHNGLGEKFGKNGELSRAIVTKLSLGDENKVPHYGAQIAVNGSIHVPFEALPTRQTRAVSMTYPDGRVVELQRPVYGLQALQYGGLPAHTQITQRRAPALVGLGLLAAVEDAAILANADPEDANDDGISGRPNWIGQGEQRQLGRFTAKASVSTVIEQVASAAAFDMGLTNAFHPEEQCEPIQKACRNAPRGRPAADGEALDLTMPRLQAIASFLMLTKVPITQNNSDVSYQGAEIFQEIGCAICHLPLMKTREGVEIAPYTDMLLHDMGEALSDNRTEHTATGQEFRTAPLWGLSTYAKTLQSKQPYYLHDARARSLEEAILWHGGEATQSRRKFMNLSQTQRDELIQFLHSL